MEKCSSCGFEILYRKPSLGGWPEGYALVELEGKNYHYSCYANRAEKPRVQVLQ